MTIVSNGVSGKLFAEVSILFSSSTTAQTTLIALAALPISFIHVNVLISEILSPWEIIVLIVALKMAFSSLLTLKIKTIEFYCPTRSVYVHRICYDYKQHFAKIIQRYYRKYRLKKARLRNDLVIRGLMEYFYHPSRLTFEI